MAFFSDPFKDPSIITSINMGASVSYHEFDTYLKRAGSTVTRNSHKVVASMTSGTTGAKEAALSRSRELFSGDSVITINRRDKSVMIFKAHVPPPELIAQL